MIVKIQALYRGYICRKNNKSLKDNMSLDIVNLLLDRHIDNFKFNENINLKLSKKKYVIKIFRQK